jgi:hypothetical protein
LVVPSSCRAIGYKRISIVAIVRIEAIPIVSVAIVVVGITIVAIGIAIVAIRIAIVARDSKAIVERIAVAEVPPPGRRIIEIKSCPKMASHVIVIVGEPPGSEGVRFFVGSRLFIPRYV